MLLTQGVGVVTLNRPTTLNAMTVAMGEEFERIMVHVTRHAPAMGLRALVLAGAGKAFSSGGTHS